MAYKDKEKQRETKRRWIAASREKIRAQQHSHYEEHRVEVIAKAAQWKKDNPERHKEWYEGFRERRNELARGYYQDNPDKTKMYLRRWRENNPKKKQEQGARYREKYREGIREKGRQYYQNNQERERLAGLERRRELKADVFREYGGACICCGEREIAFLTVDHINNNGKEHRKQGLTGTAMYRWLKKQGYLKEGFRLLCWNCNVGRAQNGGVCPHEVQRQRAMVLS